jgi:hypothetical protein
MHGNKARRGRARQSRNAYVNRVCLQHCRYDRAIMDYDEDPI